jgi:hypothetical protein
MESSNSEIEVEFDTRNDGVTGPLCKKFPDHGLKTDPNQDDKACEFKLCSVARPYMRSFHYAWWSYHVAFLMWYVLCSLDNMDLPQFRTRLTLFVPRDKTTGLVSLRYSRKSKKP